LRLTYHNHFCPCNDVVFSVMFGNSYLFCKLCSAVTGELVEIIGNPHSQATLNENDVMLNKIRFDSFAFGKSNKFYSVDIQRKYKKSRQERRTVYYACRAVSTQEVRQMAYEKLKPVNISFILRICEKIT